jgi:hypothetical protein
MIDAYATVEEDTCISPRPKEDRHPVVGFTRPL